MGERPASQVAKDEDYQKKWREEHRAELSEYQKKYQAENKKRIAEQKHANYLANRDKVIARAKAAYYADPQSKIDYAVKWNREHPEARARIQKNWYDLMRQDPDKYAKQLASWIKYRTKKCTTEEGREFFRNFQRKLYDSLREDPEFREKENARLRKLYADNPERSRANGRRSQHNRRAKLGTGGGTYTEEEIADLYKKQRGRCVGICGGTKLGDDYEIDHVIPVDDGGPNVISNLQLLCMPCNRKKGRMSPEKWAARLGKLFV